MVWPLFTWLTLVDIDITYFGYSYTYIHYGDDGCVNEISDLENVDTLIFDASIYPLIMFLLPTMLMIGHYAQVIYTLQQ